MRESTPRGPAINLDEFERRLRGQEPKPAPAKADPLSELARLIQADPQASAADPYAAQQPQQPPAAPGWSLPPAPPRAARAAPPPREPYLSADLRGSYPSEAPPAEPAPYAAPPPPPHAPGRAEERAYAQQPAYPEPPAAYADERQYYAEAQQQAYDDEYPAQRRQPQQPEAYRADPHGQPAWPDDPNAYADYDPQSGYGDDDDADEPPRPGLLSRLKLRPWHAVVGVAVVGVASIGWGFAHRGGKAPQEIATIEAPAGPVKVAPTAETEQAAATPGAAILDRKEQEPVNRVVDHQEQAVDPKAAPRAVKLGDGPVDAPHEPAAAAPPPEPRRVKTVSVRPDGSVIKDDAPPPAATEGGEAQEGAGRTPQTPAKPVTTPRQAQGKEKPKIAAAPEEAPAEETPAAGGSGVFSVQFGAADSESEARALLTKIAGKYRGDLGGRKPTYKMAKVNGKTVYRVRVAGVSKDQANAICGKVKTGGGTCFVAGD